MVFAVLSIQRSSNHQESFNSPLFSAALTAVVSGALVIDELVTRFYQLQYFQIYHCFVMRTAF